MNKKAIFSLTSMVFGLTLGLSSASAQDASTQAAPEEPLKGTYKSIADLYSQPGEGDARDKSKSLAELSAQKPEAKFAGQNTTNQTIAFLFHKLSGVPINYEEWAENMRAADPNLPAFRGYGELQAAAENLRDQASLIAPNEIINVEAYTALKSHSENSSGLLVQNFNESTLFKYEYLGQKYAVLPTDLMDHQWIKLSPEELSLFRENMDEKGQLFMRLMLRPQRASRTIRSIPGYGEGWLMTAEVADIEFWSPKTQNRIWKRTKDSETGQDRLLELYYQR